MATVLIRFDGGDVPVVTGAIPPDEHTPIESPTQTGYKTNHGFIVAPGVYCYGLESADAHTPLWQVVQAVDGQQATVAFERVGT
jgi:hypothetical protein